MSRLLFFGTERYIRQFRRYRYNTGRLALRKNLESLKGTHIIFFTAIGYANATTPLRDKKVYHALESVQRIVAGTALFPLPMYSTGIPKMGSHQYRLLGVYR